MSFASRPHEWDPGDPLAAAAGYVAAGLSVVPVRADGSKASALARGEIERDRDRPATPAELAGWFGRARPLGIAVLGGAVSGNLLVLDFETMAAYGRWRAGLSADELAVLARCPVVLTPGGGAHVYVRTTEALNGAVYARTAAGSCLAETRGRGQYVVAPGSPPGTHRGGPYRFEALGWLDGTPANPVPVDAVYGWVVRMAGLNEYVRPRRVVGDGVRTRPGGPAGDRPGDQFNAKVSWADILPRRGWTVYRVTDGATYWTRPGKPAGVSASTGFCKGPGGRDLLYVFTSSASPFEPGVSYSRFGAYALLEHGGDFAAATKARARAGYGVPLPRPPRTLWKGRPIPTGKGVRP